MHVALIVDEERLTNEHATLNRLSIGLIGEGIQLTRIVPDSLPSHTIGAGEQRMALAAKLQTPMKVLPWMKRDRVTQLLESMAKKVPDVLYALGEPAWSVGMDLARAAEKPLAFDVWSAGQIRSVPRRHRHTTLAGYIAPTAPLADALRRRVDPDLVSLVPMGVALPREPRTVLAEPEKSIALAVVGGGRDVPAYRALLGGLSRIIREMPQVHVIMEMWGPNEHEIWRHAQRLELLEHVSTITRGSQHRGLLTQCDMMLLPERYGEVRSLVLEAMAFGLPIVSSDDPFMDMLVDGKSAAIVHQPEADAWARQIQRLLNEPDSARSLGLGGREHVADHHRSSDQVSRLLETLERIATGGSYRFESSNR